MNKKRCIQFKDTWAAPGSQLHQALTDGNKKLALKIYHDCDNAQKKLEGREGKDRWTDEQLKSFYGLKPVDHDIKGNPIYDQTAVRLANAPLPVFKE